MRPATVGQSTQAFGLARFTWFAKLNDSARNCTLKRSLMAKLLKKERSHCEKPGPTSRLRPTEPNAPFCGRRHGPSVCPLASGAEAMGNQPFRSGLSLL